LSEHTYNDEVFAQFYDIIIERMGAKDLELDFWKSCAETFGDPILYLGCGTGRLLLPLAELGYFITGIDSSPYMLNILRQKLRRVPANIRKNVRLKLGDMVNPRLLVNKNYFHLIMFPASQFLHLKTDVQRLKCLKNSSLVMADDGVLVISNSKLDKGRRNDAKYVKVISKPNDPFILETWTTLRKGVFRRYFKLVWNKREFLFYWTLYPIESSHLIRLIQRAGLRTFFAPRNISLPKKREIYFCKKYTV